tara:strand:+ start:1490 stop:2584 length:1095 start_codon:yes stop_codon:yes gene_type:complete
MILKQSGAFTFGATQDVVTITLPTAVDINLTFIHISVGNSAGTDSISSEAGDYIAAPELTNLTGDVASDITVRRFYLNGAKTVSVTWRTFTMLDGEGTVEHGSTVLTSASTDEVVSNFIQDKSFSLGYLYSTAGSYGGKLDTTIIQHKVHDNGVNDVMTIDTPFVSSSFTFYWQVITLNRASVQTIETNINTAGTSHTAAINDVTIDRAMHLHSYCYTDVASDAGADNIKGVDLTAVDELEFKSYAEYDQHVTSYVVESPFIFVQHGVEIDWTTDQRTVTFPIEIREWKGISLLGGPYTHWQPANSALFPSHFAHFGHRDTFLNSDQMTDQFSLDRGGAASTATTTYWQIVEFDKPRRRIMLVT